MENRGKIKICSKEALQAINDRCTKKLLDVVDGRNLSEDEKEKIKARIVALFQQAMAENTVFDEGKSAQNSDTQPPTTTEQEPFNTERKQWLNSSLYPELDKAVVNTSKQRRHCPFQAVQLQAKQCKFEHTELIRYKAETTSVIPETEDDRDADDRVEQAQAKSNDAIKDLCQYTGAINKLIKDTENITTSLQMSAAVNKL